MINQFEIPMYLENVLPELSKRANVPKKNNAYKLMDELLVYTIKNIKQQNYKVVKQCFKIADKLYCKGNAVVKNAVENVFVYSFTTIFQSCPAQKKKLLAMLPLTLFTVYMSQVYHSGC